MKRFQVVAFVSTPAKRSGCASMGLHDHRSRHHGARFEGGNHHLFAVRMGRGGDANGIEQIAWAAEARRRSIALGADQDDRLVGLHDRIGPASRSLVAALIFNFIPVLIDPICRSSTTATRPISSEARLPARTFAAIASHARRSRATLPAYRGGERGRSFRVSCPERCRCVHATTLVFRPGQSCTTHPGCPFCCYA